MSLSRKIANTPELRNIVADTLRLLRSETAVEEDRMLRMEAMSPPPDHVVVVPKHPHFGIDFGFAPSVGTVVVVDMVEGTPVVRDYHRDPDQRD